jgi:hypothetical protein
MENKTACDQWNEMSYKKYNKKNRKREYEKDVFELENDRTDWMISVANDSDYSFETLMEVTNPIGLLEDITLDNCFGVEDIMDYYE